MLVSKYFLGLVTLVAGSTGAALAWQMRMHTTLRAAADNPPPTAATLRTLEQQLATETQRLADAETRLSTLLKTAQKTTTTASTRSAKSSPSEPIDASEVARLAIEQGKRLIAAGKAQEALDAYVKAYREVQPFRPGSSACQSLMSAMKHLARTFPPALSALERLRDDALQQLQARPSAPSELRFEVALLNERLGQGERTLALFDGLPTGDIQRTSLARIARDSFIKNRRYPDALLGKPFGEMVINFDAGIRHLEKELDSSRQTMVRTSIVDQTLTNIEVLAGAGRADEARQLTEKLLAFDTSLATRARLDEHLARAQGAKP